MLKYHRSYNKSDHISPLNTITFSFPSPRLFTMASESLLNLAPAHLSGLVSSFLLLPSHQPPLCSAKTEAQVFLTSMFLNWLVGLHGTFFLQILGHCSFSSFILLCINVVPSKCHLCLACFISICFFHRMYHKF